MQQTFKLKKVPSSQVLVEASGPSIDTVHRTLVEGLNKTALATYSKAITKVLTRQKLNVTDLRVFDKIDEITMAEYGFCLKDSLVTKARLKACKRYKVKFNDRGGLVDHLKMIESGSKVQIGQQVDNGVVDEFLNGEGVNKAEAFSLAAKKYRGGIDLELDDLQAIAQVVAYVAEIRGWGEVHPETDVIVAKACAELGISLADFVCLTKAFGNIH